jgi:hypothetical protein
MLTTVTCIPMLQYFSPTVSSGCYQNSKYCNRFDQSVTRQQLCKHGPTRNSIDEAVFSISYALSSGEQRGYATLSKQRLGKHTSGYVATSSTIETVCSVESVQSTYKRSDTVTELVRGQLPASRKLEE